MITFLKVTRQLLGDIKGGVLGYRGAACIPCVHTNAALMCEGTALLIIPSLDAAFSSSRGTS
eukprot:scaffold239197_cov21-Tisochrysis_lutea.AAC.4